MISNPEPITNIGPCLWCENGPPSCPKTYLLFIIGFYYKDLFVQMHQCPFKVFEILRLCYVYFLGATKFPGKNRKKPEDC